MAISQNRRERLADKVKSLKDEKLFTELEIRLSGTMKYIEAIKPVKKSLSIDEMKKNQSYRPLNKEQFFQKTKELHFKEPLEKLLSMLD